MNLDDQSTLRNVGNLIRDLRLERRLTQSQLGEASGLHRTFIGSVLTGTNTYANGTTIVGGTLQLGNGGATGSLTGAIVNNGS